MIDFIEHVNPDTPQIRIVSTLRYGGVSAVPYGSLNLAEHVGDAHDCVATNRARLRSALALPEQFVWLNQIHGTRIVSTTEALNFKRATSRCIDADGIWCDQSNIVCAVLTADCLPLVIASRSGEQFACVHVGWKGLAQGIVEQSVARLQQQEPTNTLWAWAGPCIGPSAFEVGGEVRAALQGSESAWRPSRVVNGEQKWLCNLYQIVGERLEGLGVTEYAHADACTYKQSEQYFSYRRDGVTGRQATLVWRI